MNYGCDVSNRYTGYLDSDPGHSTNTIAAKNKRKTKKKRKPKNRKSETDAGINDNRSSNCDVMQDQQQLLSIDNKNEDNEQFIEQKSEQEVEQEPIVNVTLTSSSLLSSESPVQSETSKEMKESDAKSNSTSDNLNGSDTKWGTICFEEETELRAPNAPVNGGDDQKTLDEPEMMFKKHRIYPTVYFYNSNFGNKNRRVVYNDGNSGSGRRYYHQGNYEPNKQMGNENQKKQRNRHVKRQQSNYNATNVIDYGSVDAKPMGSFNETIKRASSYGQQGDEFDNNREYTKNRYNKFKHSGSEQTFSRRRTDFVRNV